MHVELSNGGAVDIPIHLIPEIANSASHELANVEVDPLGKGPLWRDLNVRLDFVAVLDRVLVASLDPAPRDISAGELRAPRPMLRESMDQRVAGHEKRLLLIEDSSVNPVQNDRDTSAQARNCEPEFYLRPGTKPA